MSLFLNRGYLITKMEGAGRKILLLFYYLLPPFVKIILKQGKDSVVNSDLNIII